MEHKTDEVPGKYTAGGSEQEDDIKDAYAMMGWGEPPSLEIEQSRVVSERRGRKLVDAQRPAFVKIYTSFKQELREIDEVALKVWLYLALSVNRFTEEAHPGLRTIAKETNLAVNTVRDAVERLETKYNLLTVQRGNRKYNRYFPVDYVSAHRDETVSANDTDGKTVSDGPQTVSVEGKTVSARLILNQRNQNLQPEGGGLRNPLFGVYENNIGSITPLIANKIEAAEKVYGPEWIKDAILLAAKNSARHWHYCESILENWKRNGRQEPAKPKERAAVNPEKYTQGEYAEYLS